MRPTLAHSARLLSHPDPVARTRGANLSYEICLARCVAPITPLAPVSVALGRDYLFLAPVLRRLGRSLRIATDDKDAVDLVIASARALAAISALLVFAQRCDVDVAALSHIAAPLRSRCTPALVVPLLATDLRVVGAARDALDQIVLLRVAHQTPWLDVLLALRSFRTHYMASSAANPPQIDQDDVHPVSAGEDQQSLLTLVLTRVSALLRVVFVDVANRAEISVRETTQPAAITSTRSLPRSPSTSRRRSSISGLQSRPSRVAAMSSWHGRSSGADHSLPSSSGNRSKRFMDKIRRSRRRRLNTSGTTLTSGWQCEEGGAPCDGCRFCSPSDPDSFEYSAHGMRFSNRMKRQEGSATHINRSSTVSGRGRVSTDSSRNIGRKSLEHVLPNRGRRDSINQERVNRKSSTVSSGRRKRLSLVGVAQLDKSAASLTDVVQPCKWKGEHLGVKNRDIAAAMHIYERLLSRFLLPSMQDRCQVIDDLHRLAHPLLTGVTAGQSHVDAAALRCTVANAFLSHGSEIYPALLALVFRPAPSPQRTEEVKRHLSLQSNMITTDDASIGMRKGRRYRTTDISEHVMGSMNFLGEKDLCKSEKNTPVGQTFVCLPNSECETDTAMRCSALLTLLVRNVPNLCNPRLPLMTGSTNSAYWHCAEALVEEGNENNRSITWSVERLVGAVDALFLLIASLPDAAEVAIQTVKEDSVELDNIVETCMRSVCASGSRLSRIDARPSAPSLSDTGVVQSARAWVALSKLPSQSVLWPSGPAYSSAIVFVAHLARRAALSVYKKRRLQEIDYQWQVRNGLASCTNATPTSPIMSINEKGNSGVSGFEMNENANSNSALGNSQVSALSPGNGAHGGTDSSMIDSLEECINILVHRNGSSVVVHDLFRTLLYIMGCELRGSPTRGSVVTTSHITVNPGENIIAGTSLKESCLPARAPMFTHAAHSPQGRKVKDSFALSSSVPRMSNGYNNIDPITNEITEVEGVPVQSRATRVSVEENDMSGLLVGNIAVDGSRDNKLRDTASKAGASAVAGWFAGLIPPLNTHTGHIGSSARTTPEHVLGTSSKTDNPSVPGMFSRSTSSCDPGCAPLAELSAFAAERGVELVAPELFEELCTAIAITLNSVSTAAAAEGEDVTVAMDIVAEDVQRANSFMVTQMHRRAVRLLKQSKVGTANSVWNPVALLRQVRDLQMEVESLRNDMECLKASLGHGDEMRRFRWPLRSHPRPTESGVNDYPVSP